MDPTGKPPDPGRDQAANESTGETTTGSVTHHRNADRNAMTARRVSGVAAHMPFLRTATVEQRREWRQVIADARQKATQRRTRVLVHPDLAERLRAVLRLRAPDQWQGFVPPRLDANGLVGANPSPIRREIVEILHAVAEREGPVMAGRGRIG